MITNVGLLRMLLKPVFTFFIKLFEASFLLISKNFWKFNLKLIAVKSQ